MCHGRKLPESLVFRRKDLRIVRAAILLDNGAVFSLPPPARHHHLIKELRENGYTGPLSGERQGFLLNNGQFARRKPALAIAEEAGQLLTGDTISWQLTTEDLW